MKKVAILCLIVGLLGIGKKSLSQDYDGSIGVRLGVPMGITYKNFFSKRTAFEGILTIAASENTTRIGLTALIEGHIGLADQLNFLYGVGGHVSSGPIVGIDGIIGLEYAFDAIPFSLSLDWKPAFNLIRVGDSPSMNPSEFALSVRFYW